MPKSRKHSTGDKKKEVEEAIDRDPRFADIKKDPVFKMMLKWVM